MWSCSPLAVDAGDGGQSRQPSAETTITVCRLQLSFGQFGKFYAQVLKRLDEGLPFACAEESPREFGVCAAGDGGLND